MPYKVEIKTPDGVYDYEVKNLDSLETLLQEHPNYDSLEAKEVGENGKEK